MLLLLCVHNTHKGIIKWKIRAASLKPKKKTGVQNAYRSYAHRLSECDGGSSRGVSILGMLLAVAFKWPVF